MTIPTPSPNTAIRWYPRRPAAWQYPAFRRLALAWIPANLADSALYLMAAVWVKELTGSDGAAALVFVMLGLPALAAPFMGQLADRVSRRSLLVVAHVVIAAIVATLFLANSASWVWLIYAVIVAYGAMGHLNASAQAGLVRDILPDEHLASGNGLLSGIDQSLRLVSPLVGTGIYALAGAHVVVAITVACFLLSATAFVTMRLQESEPETAASRGAYGQEVTAGFRHLVRTPRLARLTLLLALACAATGMVNASVFPALEQGMGLPASALGVLMTSQGLGAVAGGLSAAWAIRRFGERQVFAIGMALLGIGTLPVVGNSIASLVVGLVILGHGITISVVAFMVLRQRLTPARLQGRTNAAANMAINVPQTAATAAAAALLGIVDYRMLVVATVLVILGAALAALPPESPSGSRVHARTRWGGPPAFWPPAHQR